MTITRPPYPGSRRKLVLGFDIGTTYSGVSYALLDPGKVPEIVSIGRFLDNSETANFKISSIMFYDHDGNFRGVKGTLDEEEVENLYELRWWKLKLSPKELPEAAKKYMTADLPKGKSKQDVFSDFIRYLFDSAKAFIQESEPVGKKLWESLEPNIDLILSHPNGWDGREQEILRRAVVQASVFTEAEAISRVSFVTEGEASFNFCVINTVSGELLEPGHKVLVVDAGGGTVDVSSYTVKSTWPLEVEEFHEPKCFYEGAEVVTARAREYAQWKLKDSNFCSEDELKAFTEGFDTKLKVAFKDSNKPHSVQFTSMRENDTRYGIKGGRLRLQGDEVEKFFEPSVNAIVESIKDIATEADPENTFVFLTGGFGASPWVFKEVGREIATKGLKLSRPDSHGSKAVAAGAISYYLDHFVVCRIVKWTYGAESSISYDPSDPEHRKRSHKKYLGLTGNMKLDVFMPTLFKGTRVHGTREFRKPMANITPLPLVAEHLQKFPIIRYTGTLEKPQWMDEDQENFKTVSHISVDIGGVPDFTRMSPLGFPVFIQEFEVVNIYGQTEFKAQLSWMEGRTDKRTHAAVLYDDEEQTLGT